MEYNGNAQTTASKLEVSGYLGTSLSALVHYSEMADIFSKIKAGTIQPEELREALTLSQVTLEAAVAEQTYLAQKADDTSELHANVMPTPLTEAVIPTEQPALVPNETYADAVSSPVPDMYVDTQVPGVPLDYSVTPNVN